MNRVITDARHDMETLERGVMQRPNGHAIEETCPSVAA